MLERLARDLRPPFRADVRLRQALRAGTSDLAAAREHLRLAYADDPENENLARIDVAITMATGDLEAIRERGLFWSRRVRTDETEAWSPEAGAFFDRLAADPEQALLLSELPEQIDPGLAERFLAVVRGLAKRPVAAVELVNRGISNGAIDLSVAESNATLLREWRRVWPSSIGSDERIARDEGITDAERIWRADSVEPWIAFIELHGEALDDVAILDDILDAATVLPASGEPWFERALALPIAARARSLIEPALGAAATAALEPLRLPLRYPENGAALRLMEAEAAIRKALDGADDLELLRRLWALDPEDPFALRARLMNALLHARKDDQALALAAAHPEDGSIELGYGRVLTLLRCMRSGARPPASRPGCAVRAPSSTGTRPAPNARPAGAAKNATRRPRAPSVSSPSRLPRSSRRFGVVSRCPTTGPSGRCTSRSRMPWDGRTITCTSSASKGQRGRSRCASAFPMRMMSSLWNRARWRAGRCR